MEVSQSQILSGLNAISSRIEKLEKDHKNLQAAHKEQGAIIHEIRKKSETHEMKLRENNLMIFDLEEGANETP